MNYVVDPILWTTEPSKLESLCPGFLLLAGCWGEGNPLRLLGPSEQRRTGDGDIEPVGAMSRTTRPHWLSRMQGPASSIGLGPDCLPRSRSRLLCIAASYARVRIGKLSFWSETALAWAVARATLSVLCRPCGAKRDVA